jgi:archaellum component FlaG (FlaF/FlaG flagellin family)
MDKVIVSGLLIIASITAAVMTISIITPALGSNSESIVRSNRIASDFASTGFNGLTAVADGGNGATISAWFKNVGSVDVEPISAIGVFLLTGDGLSGRYILYSSDVTASDRWAVVQPADSKVWARGETLQIQLTLDPSISTGTYKVSLKTPNGISGDISFEYGN